MTTKSVKKELIKGVRPSCNKCKFRKKCMKIITENNENTGFCRYKN